MKRNKVRKGDKIYWEVESFNFSETASLRRWQLSHITKVASQEVINGESNVGRKNCKCRGQEAGRCPVWSKKVKEAIVVGLENMKSNRAGVEATGEYLDSLSYWKKKKVGLWSE